MRTPSLASSELALLRSVFRRHPEITEVRLFGSRAKGTHSFRSDIDLAIWGNVGRLQAQAIAAELDDLPLLHDRNGLQRVVIPALLEDSLEHLVNGQCRHHEARRRGDRCRKAPGVWPSRKEFQPCR